MNKIRNALLFTLVLLPVAALAGFFTAKYQMAIYDPAILEEILTQVGSAQVLTVITIAQTIMYAAVCGFTGYLLAEKTGLMKPVRLEKKPMIITLILSLAGGVLFSLDYWTFGALMPELREGMDGNLSLDSWIASVLYGGIIEEVMLRLFVMSLLSLIIWKIFARKSEKTPTGAVIAANIISSMLFAAGHLPATVACSAR